MYCVECGEKLTLVFNHKEGLVPFCKKCNEYRFPQFATAVSMVVTNRNKDRILLAKHKDQSDYIAYRYGGAAVCSAERYDVLRRYRLRGL